MKNSRIWVLEYLFSSVNIGNQLKSCLQPISKCFFLFLFFALTLTPSNGYPQTASSPPSHDIKNSLLPEINRYTEVHKRSTLFRADIQGLSSRLGNALEKKDSLPQELLQTLQDYKREYFSIRKTLFGIAFLHASAIVEQSAERDRSERLLKTSLSLMSASDIVQNFHAVSILLSESDTLREVWNQADLAYGIPEKNWEISLEAYHNARYQDLFEKAITRVKNNRVTMKNFPDETQFYIHLLFPEGIDVALQRAEETYSLLREQFAEEDLSLDEKELRQLVTRSKEQRSIWTSSGPLLRETILSEGGLIRGNVHIEVHVAKQAYLELREDLYHLAFKHMAKLTRDDVAYPHKFRLRAMGISLLAAATLYENTNQLEKQILTIPGVRDLLNQGNPALGIPPRFLDDIEEEYVNVEYKILLRTGMDMIDREQNLPDGAWVREDALLKYVMEEISNNEAVSKMIRQPFYVKFFQLFGYYGKKLKGFILGMPKEGTAPLSKVFGSLVGKVAFRNGKLYDQEQWVKFVKTRLQPGDILLDKTPFRLTDKFIPGHFGHVALYVGTEGELRNLGLLDHPWVKPYLTEISKGRTIVEALREGTQINTIEHFLNIDDLAILRPKKNNIPKEDVIKAIALAFSHIGKKYDFDFDNNSWDTIVCSELAFHSYVNVRWPFTKMLGSYTISPDEVAVSAGFNPSRPFQLVTFVHDGRISFDQLTGVLDETLYTRLLGKHYAEAFQERKGSL